MSARKFELSNLSRQMGTKPGAGLSSHRALQAGYSTPAIQLTFVVDAARLLLFSERQVRPLNFYQHLLCFLRLALVELARQLRC